MGISLYGLTPATTYDALIKTGDNEPLTASLKVLSDGVGTNLPMEASTTGVNFTGTLTQAGTTLQPTLVSGTNIKTINSTSLLGSGNINVVTSPSGVAGAIQFSNGSAFASDATNLFWDDTNNRLGIGTNAPTSPLQVAGTITTQNLLTSGVIYGGSFWLQENGILALGQQSAGPSKFFVKGSGSTSATTSLLVQNSAGTQGLKIDDALGFQLGLLGNNGAGCSVRTDGNNGGFFSGVNISINNGFAVLDSANTKVAWVPDAGGFRIPNSSRYPVTIGADTKAVASAQLEMVSTTQGFLPPRMTTTQRDAIVTPATGLSVYNTTLGTMDTYDGAIWQRIGKQTLIKGSGSTSSTTALLVQNSAGVSSLQVKDDGSVFNYGKGAISSNCAFGEGAIFSNTSGTQITAFGTNSLSANSTGVRNTAFGNAALTSTSTGSSNNAFGYRSLVLNTSGSNNTAMGDLSLERTTVSNNTAFGSASLQNTSTGSGNVAVGANSLNAHTTGSNNSALGFNTASGNFSGSVILGNDATATASNQFVVGSSGTNAGAVTTATAIQTKTWDVIINGVAQKILLA